MPGKCEKCGGDMSVAKAFLQSVQVVVCATTLFALGLVPLKNVPKINLNLLVRYLQR